MRAMIVLCVLSTMTFGATDIDSGGFILRWMLLGPYGQTGNNNPGCPLMVQDFLTDGTVTEANVKPFPGLAVETDYGIAASTGLTATPNNPAANPGGIPTWYECLFTVDTIDFQVAPAYATDVDDVMAYACIYVKNLTGAAIANCTAGMDSDDAIQCIVGTESVWCNSVARGVGASGSTPDISDTFTLPVGVTRLMVKVFEGAGGWAFRLNLRDGSGTALLSNRIALTTIPYGPCPTTATVDAFVDSWAREAVFQWDYTYSLVQIYEGGVKLAETSDSAIQSIAVGGLEVGSHRLEFRTRIGDDEPACATVEKLVDVLPVWPAGFQCTYSEAEGAVQFYWRNLEGYYDVLKIQEGGVDVLGLAYSMESAQINGVEAGTHTYTLVAERDGYASAGITCTVDVTGPPPQFRRGDANADRSVNVADAVFLLTYLFAHGPASACEDSADSNDDGRLDISDAVATLRHLFASAAMPAPGATTCGADPTADTLAACDYDVCQ